MKDLLGDADCSRQRMLHMAPEDFFRESFRTRFGHYVAADLAACDVDVQFDVCALPFADASFDLVYASHVLEHVRDDLRAIAEIRRVLATGGIAILPVPLVSNRTIEYPAPNPAESMHVRAPGPDYFERYRRHFSRVDLHASSDYPDRFQTHAYENRSAYPSPSSPLREPMPGTRHADIVPVCHA